MARWHVDRRGQQIGRLTVLSATKLRGRFAWKCHCECGNLTVVSSNNLAAKAVKSCGCLRSDVGKRTIRIAVGAATHAKLRHGHSIGGASPTYRTWQSMRTRCHNPRSQDWPDYGAKGVTVCEAWRTSFDAFLRDMGPRPDGLSLDRINPFGNYEPSNCRWATDQQQRHNRRRNYAHG